MRTNILQVRKTLLALFAMLMPLVASAHVFEVDAIYYNITSEADKTAEVTYKGIYYDSYTNEYSGSITIPATITYNGVNYSVTSIGESAFEGCSSLTAITIPEGVTSIGDKAFCNCYSLTAITIPEGVTSIGSYAFSDCSSLTAITIPEDSKLTSIGYGAFDGCSSLTAVHISSLEVWCNIDFASSSANPLSSAKNLYLNGDLVTELTIPYSVTAIKNNAFYGWSSLTAITIPENSQLTSIGDYAFLDCESLKTVINYSDLPLQRGSFDYGWVAHYADRVINVDEFIGDYAFKTKDNAHYLTGYIGDAMELTLPDNYQGENYQIGERAFYKCSSLTTITIPEGVTSIGSSAFYGCSSLTAITIPEGVTSIGEYTFYGCSNLKELTLGKGIRKIESRAFYGCTALEKVTTYATRPPAAADINIFSDATYENATLYVPQGCIDKYQVMTGWSGFYTIEEMEGGTPNYLTLRQADNGAIGIVVELGRTYKMRITAFEGWKIHSVTFNGEEVTDQLTEEGTFTTPALQADAVLNIAYEKIEDNAIVANAQTSRIKVQGHHGTLRITGTTEGDDISVYTTDGMLVAQESAEESETTLTLPIGQVYIVTVADKVVKIGM